MKKHEIFLRLEKINSNDVQLEFDFPKDEENNFYILGIASTPDVNSYGFIMESSALIQSWKNYQAQKKNVAVYEKHGLPIGKVVSCELVNDKVLIAMEIPRKGNARVLSVYEQGIYTGLSVGGWRLDGNWDDEDVFHVTEFEWYEVSLTDIPSNENATILEFAHSEKDKLTLNKELDLIADRILTSIGGI